MYRRFKLLLFIFILLGPLTFVGTQFGFVQQVKASPDMYESHPTAHEISAITVYDPTYAYDSDDLTDTYFNYGKGPAGYYQVVDFSTPADGTITRVDFKMRYEAEANTEGETYTIEFYVGTVGVTLVGATGAAHPLGTEVWSDISEPNDGTWSWGDIYDIEFRVSISAKSGKTMDSFFYEYETWVTVYYTPPPPEIFVDPPSVSTERGFHVNINISNVEGLYTWSLRLSWNQSLFECAKAVEGPFLERGGSTSFTSKIYNDLGYIYLINSLMGMVPGVDGSGTLATVYFTSSKNNGNCSLHLYDSTLIKPDMSTITHTLQDGNFDNRGLTLIPAATIAVDPPSVATREAFSVNITIASVTELNSYRFYLRWNATLINSTAATEGPFLKSAGTTFFYQSIDNTNGFLFVVCRLLTGTPPSGSGTLATLNFSAYKEIGKTSLDLYNTELSDIAGEYWYHTVTDGYYDNTAMPEFPLGAAMEIGLAMLIIYVWWKRKRKIGPSNYNRSVKPS